MCVVVGEIVISQYHVGGIFLSFFVELKLLSFSFSFCYAVFCSLIASTNDKHTWRRRYSSSVCSILGEFKAQNWFGKS